MKEYIKTYEIKPIKSSIPIKKISTSLEAYRYIKQFYNDDLLVYESFYLLMLNKANFTTGFVKISQGGRAGTVVDIQIILKYLVDTLSGAFIMAHNHPSGNTNPSVSDINITKKIKQAVKCFDINLLDHIILTENSYYSFTDEGYIN